jgi:hypothetical protein
MIIIHPYLISDEAHWKADIETCKTGLDPAGLDLERSPEAPANTHPRANPESRLLVE